MIEATERQVAETKIDVVKSAVKDCHLDYYLCETPFSISINIRKKIIKDFSPKVMSPTSPAFTPVSIPSSDISLLPSSPNDSGVSLKCPSCEDMEKILGETRKEIIENELKSKKKIEDLQKDFDSKNSVISNLNSKIKGLEDTHKNLKNEVKVKNEQVKQQKGNVENIREKLEKLNTEKETLKVNLSKKVATLENKNKELVSSLKKTTSDLDKQKIEFRKVDYDLQSIRNKQLAMKHSESQTEIKQFKSIEMQTVKIETNYIDVGVQTVNKSFETNKNSSTESLSSNKTETGLFFKKSTLPPWTVNCTSCFGQHIIEGRLELSWPKEQHYESKYIPISSEEREWPDKEYVDAYIKDFGDHKCEDCVKDEAPWKKTTCDNRGESSKHKGSSVYVCVHNLVEFGSLRWWERMGLP